MSSPALFAKHGNQLTCTEPDTSAVVLVSNKLRASPATEHMTEEFIMLHFEPYAPTRRQLLNWFRAVNRARRQARGDRVPADYLGLKRRIYRPLVSKDQSTFR